MGLWMQRGLVCVSMNTYNPALQSDAGAPAGHFSICPWLMYKCPYFPLVGVATYAEYQPTEFVTKNPPGPFCSHCCCSAFCRPPPMASFRLLSVVFLFTITTDNSNWTAPRRRTWRRRAGRHLAINGRTNHLRLRYPNFVPRASRPPSRRRRDYGGNVEGATSVHFRVYEESRLSCRDNTAQVVVGRERAIKSMNSV